MDALYLGFAVLLVLANGFFVAFEFSIVRVRASRLTTLIEEGRPGAATALKMSQDLAATLSAIQFGVTLASLGLGWLGEPAFARLIEPGIGKIAPAWAVSGVSHTVSLVAGFCVITTLHIVVGELGPKGLALQKTTPTAVTLSIPMRAFMFLAYPGVWLLNNIAKGVMRAVGLKPFDEVKEAHSEDELRLILASSARQGAIATSRAELLERALEMLEKTVRQVLVPRTQIRYLDLEEPIEKNVADARLGGHTWLPVCRGGLDRVEGVVNVKDLFFLLSRGELKSIAQVQRPVLFVPETATLEQLLSEFRRRKRQMAVVVDEHGGTSGIVTIADIVAEVVGDIAELGRKVEEVRTLPGGRLELPGTTELEDLEDRLGVEFDVEDGEVTTVAGFLMAKLNRVPAVGDRWAVGEYEIGVEEVDGPRVTRVRIEPRKKLTPPPPAPPV